MEGVTFRRINGRVVPIHINNKEQNKLKDRALGGAEIAAGAGLSVLAGRKTSQMVTKAQKLAQQSRVQYKAGKALKRASDIGQQFLSHDPLIKGAAEHHLARAVGKRMTARNMFRMRNIMLHTAAAASAGLIAAGAKRITDSLNVDNKQQKNAHIGKFAAVGGAAATYAAYYNKMGFGWGKTAANVMARFKGLKRPYQKTLNLGTV